MKRPPCTSATFKSSRHQIERQKPGIPLAGNVRFPPIADLSALTRTRLKVAVLVAWSFGLFQLTEERFLLKFLGNLEQQVCNLRVSGLGGEGESYKRAGAQIRRLARHDA